MPRLYPPLSFTRLDQTDTDTKFRIVLTTDKLSAIVPSDWLGIMYTAGHNDNRRGNR